MIDEIHEIKLDGDLAKAIEEGIEKFNKAFDEAIANGYVPQKPYFKARRKDFTKVYECDDYKCDAHPRGCLFCKHSTDVWWDYTNGPYMIMCDIDTEGKELTRKGFIGKCKYFDFDE